MPGHPTPPPSRLPGIRLLAGFLGLLLPLLGHRAAAAQPPRVLTSIAPIHSWAAAVAGTNAVVENLLPSDVGPHSFHLRPSDLRRIRQADLIFANGLGLEDWLDKAIESNRSRPGAARVVRLSDGWSNQLIRELPVLELDPAKAGKHEHHHADADEAPNPHVWLDPQFARHAVSNITAELRRLDPAHAGDYQARADAYQRRLEALDRDLREALAKIPSRSIVTYHDAFPYFTRRYGLDLVGVVEEVPSVEPSPRYLATLSRVIRSRGVRVIFTEPQFNPRLVKQLGADLGVAFAELDVLETGPATPSFYEDAMRRNLATLQSTLAR